MMISKWTPNAGFGAEKQHETPTPQAIHLVEPEKTALRTFCNTSCLECMAVSVSKHVSARVASDIARIPARITNGTIATSYGIPERVVKSIRNRRESKPAKSKFVVGYTEAPAVNDAVLLSSHARNMKEGSDKLLAAILASLAKQGRVIIR